MYYYDWKFIYKENSLIMGNIKWTYEKCKEEALKYKMRDEFKKYSNSCYSKCVRDNWLDKICEHMSTKHKPKNYWTFERCKEEALKHKNKTSFSKAKGWSYQTALNNGWLDEICKHMDVIGNYKKRCIYAYEFSDNMVYIGLTFNLNKRHKRRLTDKEDAVYQYININNNYTIKKLTDYIEIEEAVKYEKIWLNNYLINGWNILNRIKTGSLGGNILKWTKEKCKEEIVKYEYLHELTKNNINCLSAIYKNNWHEELLKDLKKKNVWTYDKCLEKAKLCNSKLEFNKKYRGAYALSKKNNWYDEICLKSGLVNMKSKLYYEISDVLFEEILKERKNNKTIEELSKQFKVNQSKISKKLKERGLF